MSKLFGCVKALWGDVMWMGVQSSFVKYVTCLRFVDLHQLFCVYGGIGV
jgi:hypothetical protein